MHDTQAPKGNMANRLKETIQGAFDKRLQQAGGEQTLLTIAYSTDPPAPSK